MGGLRPVMNSFNDASVRSAEITQLRELFIDLDSEVFATFGWTDVRPTFGFHQRNNLTRFTVDEGSRDELMSRLLEENHRRAAAEAAARKSSGKGRKSKVVFAKPEALFS
jgi:hypothetical protein